MVDKVEACPFCGAPGQIIDEPRVPTMAMVMCGKDCELMPQTEWHEREEAIRRWNTRPTQDTRDRVKVLEEALERLSKPYFWTEDGFWADASTPAHRETELHQRLQIARTALGNKETYRG